MAKTLRDHISEAEIWIDSPAVGDNFAINIREECLVESHIVDVVEDGVVLAADEGMMRILESYGLLDVATEARNPISNRQQRELVKKGIFPSGAEAEHYRKQMGRAGKISTRQMKSLEKGKRPGGPNEREYANRMHADDPPPMEAADPYRREVSPPSPEEFEEGLTTGALIGAALGAKGAWHAGKKSVERNFDADEPSMLKAAGRTVKDFAQGMFDPRTYIPKKKKKEFEEAALGEQRVDSPVASAITRRILNQRHDLLQHGPEAVMAAIDQVSEWVGDVEEIGSSDVSAWVKQVERMLRTQDGQGVAEGKKGDGNLANNAKPYDKVTRGDVIAGRLGKDEMGGKLGKRARLAKTLSKFNEQSGNMSLQQLATISDEALDKAYGYGRSTPGNTFGWQANLMSAAYAKKMIDAGVTDIEKISDAIHKGWNVTAQKFVQNPEQFDDTEKLRAAGKLEAKLEQRAKLMKINYSQLPEEEKEKDRVVARALLQAIRGEQGVAEGISDKIKSLINKLKSLPVVQKNLAAARAKLPEIIAAAQQSKNGQEFVSKLSGQAPVGEGFSNLIKGSALGGLGAFEITAAAELMLQKYIAMGRPSLDQMNYGDVAGMGMLTLMMLVGALAIGMGVMKAAERPGSRITEKKGVAEGSGSNVEKILQAIKHTKQERAEWVRRGMDVSELDQDLDALEQQLADAEQRWQETDRPMDEGGDHLEMQRLRELAGMPPKAPKVTEGAIKRKIDDLYYDFREKNTLPPDADDDTYLAAVAKFLSSEGVDPDYFEDIGELFIDMRDRAEDDDHDYANRLDAEQYDDESMMEEPAQPQKEIDYDSLEVDGIDTSDYPDFSDAYFASGEYTDGTPIPGDVLDDLARDGELLRHYIDRRLYEAEYQGRKVPLGKPMAGDVKKSKVYVKGPKGNVVKVNFGDKTMRIKKSNPKRRKNFRARHNCANPGPRHKARFWSCRAW